MGTADYQLWNANWLIFKRLRSPEPIPRNRFRHAPYVALQQGRYDKPIPTRFLASITYSKISALEFEWGYRTCPPAGGLDSLESIPGLLKGLQIWALCTVFF